MPRAPLPPPLRLPQGGCTLRLAGLSVFGLLPPAAAWLAPAAEGLAGLSVLGLAGLSGPALLALMPAAAAALMGLGTLPLPPGPVPS